MFINKYHFSNNINLAEANFRIFMISFFLFIADESDNGVGLCGWLLTTISWGLVMVTLPFSLCVCFKVRILFE